jgi:pyruvate/2-oxoglutarate dehydrogenase complex dihydrolipoamide dehydrogenase (E3) component
MAKFDYDIGVLGGGAGGLTVTAGSAQLGARTVLIEKDDKLGGDCLHYGCVPSKTLIRSAHVYHMMKNAAKYGLPGVEVKPVEYRDIASRIQKVINTIQEHDSRERFCGLGAQVEFGDAVFTDEHTVKLGGKDFNAKNWLISTGSSPAIPPIEGLDKTPFLTNRDIFSLERLPKSMIVLGAGPIATEMSQAFTRLGTKVMVVQRSGQILSKEDRDMADILMEVLKGEGVDFYLNASTRRVRDLGSEREVVIEQGGKERSLKAEAILVALGRQGNHGSLGLDAIGVKNDKKGIKVDKRLRTTKHKHIYAAGDATGQFLFTHAAGYEGSIVVSNAIFHLPRKADYTFLPWCTYTDPELASIGMNEKRAEEAGIEYKVYTEDFKGNDRSLAEEERIGRIKLILDAHEKPIGVQILGPQAGELLGEWVAALNGKVKLMTLVGAVHPYPTLGEINKKVIGNLISEKIYSEKIKKGLKFFFHLKGRAACQ